MKTQHSESQGMVPAPAKAHRKESLANSTSVWPKFLGDRPSQNRYMFALASCDGHG
jgi:hypothetical protein